MSVAQFSTHYSFRFSLKHYFLTKVIIMMGNNNNLEVYQKNEAINANVRDCLPKPE